MAKSIFQKTHRKRGFLLMMVVATTIFAIVSSGLKAVDDFRYGSLHTFAQLIMVATYVFYLTVLMRAKETKSVSVEPASDGQSFLISPTWPEQVLCITDPLAIPEHTKGLRQLPRRRRDRIRAVVAQNIPLDLRFVQLIALFPQIVALDIQGSNVDPAVWDELAHFEYLQLILVHGAVSQEQVRVLALTVPEIKICIEPSRLQTETVG